MAEPLTREPGAGTSAGEAPWMAHRAPHLSGALHPPRRPGWGWGRWGWRTLTSMRTAVILLALLALAAVPGSLLPQRNVATDPMKVTGFFAEYPTLAPWLDRLGMFDVYAAPWFAAIYILLLISMTGCVLPRAAQLWRSVRADPPAAPRNLSRLSEHRVFDTGLPATDALEAAVTALRTKRFRVVTSGTEVRAERGYSRELGNLVFHLSLLVLLLGVALGRLFGFEGRVAVAEGAGFSNVPSQYDEFNRRPFTDVLGLEPFSFTLEDFRVAFETGEDKRGEPRDFGADVSYVRQGESEPQSVEVAPNSPLDIDETKVFLTGHGYAPSVTVRDGRGDVVFTGPVIFLPQDSTYASDGVIKVPDARPTELAFEGFLLPTAAIGEQGPYSAFPDALDPRLFLTAYTGDLGLDDGVPQSVFVLDKDELRQVRENGEPFARALAVGETMRLPGGQGSLTFDSVARFANFQIAYDPGKEVSLVASVLLLVGVTASLMIRRRRIWLRVLPEPTPDGGTRLEIAVLPLSRRGSVEGEVDAVVSAVGTSASDRLPETAPPQTTSHPDEKE